MNNKKIAILDFARFHGRDSKTIGSTFLRVDNLIAKDRDFFHWTQGVKADAYIFQKVYWDELMRLIKEPVILDLADPDFIKGKLYGGLDLVYISQFVDAVTCSSATLTKQVRKYIKKPVYHVPDRVNPDIFPAPRIHCGQAKKAVWFGYSYNAKRVLGDHIGQALKSSGLDLVVVSDKDFNIPTVEIEGIVKSVPEWEGVSVENIKYDSETAYYEIQKGDIFINPGGTGASFKYKSNNKTVIAWKLGLPQANSPEDFDRFLDPEERTKEASKRIKEVDEKYLIKTSGIEYKEIIEIIKNKKEKNG